MLDTYLCVVCKHVGQLPFLKITSRCACCKSLYIVPVQYLAVGVKPKPKLRLLKGGRSGE